MKINIEIDDDSKFLEALAEDIAKRREAIATIYSEGGEENDLTLNRSATMGASCFAISCNS